MAEIIFAQLLWHILDSGIAFANRPCKQMRISCLSHDENGRARTGRAQSRRARDIWSRSCQGCPSLIHCVIERAYVHPHAVPLKRGARRLLPVRWRSELLLEISRRFPRSKEISTGVHVVLRNHRKNMTPPTEKRTFLYRKFCETGAQANKA